MKKILTLFVILSVLVLPGCWDRREIGKIAIVMGFGIDAGESEDEIDITAQIANTSTIASSEKGGGEGGEKKPYLNLSSRGEYVFPSIRASVTKSGARLYMSHNYVVLFGEELAKRGVGNYMDFFLRDHELRLDMHLLVARGHAKDALDVNTGFQSIPALHINDLIRAQQQLSTGMTVTSLDFMNRLAENRAAPLLPMIEIDSTEGNDVLRMTGTAVFDRDKMIGTLSETETRGFLWCADAVGQAVVVAHPENGSVGIEVSQSTGSIEAVCAENGEVTMVLRVRAEGSLGSQRGNENYTEEVATDKLLRAFAAEIEGEIRACLDKAKLLKQDVFGFSDVVYRHHPARWEEMKDTPFYDLPVRIEVETKLDTSGRIGGPMK